MSEGSEEAAAATALKSVSEADAEQLAALVGQASDEQLTEAMADGDNRKKVLDEISGRMAAHAEPAQL